MIRLTLPYPPSAWDLYEGWGKSRRLSKSYAKWRDDAGYFIKRTEPINGPFSISIALRRPNKRQDLDNRSKAILDALQHYGVIKNDNLCERLEMVWDVNLTDECVVLVQQANEGLAA